MGELLVTHQILGLEDAGKVGLVDSNGYTHEEHLG